MAKKMTKTLITKINVGDGLTKRELECSLEFYKDAAETLRLLGPSFKLAWQDVLRTLDTLEYFDSARKRA